MSTLAGIVEHAPEFVILDAGMNGAQLVRDMRQMRSRTRSIVLAPDAEERPLVEALRAGANAYLTRDGWPRQLTKAVGAVRAGGLYVSPATNLGRAQLTREDWDIFSLRFLHGLDFEGIAEHLAQSVRDVRRRAVLLGLRLQRVGFGESLAPESSSGNDRDPEAGLAGVCEPRPPRYPRPHRAAAQDLE